jgi:glycosyltransferase involved in cell wall biosynthesis
MSGSPWGGSEELWYRTAIAAFNSDHLVEVVVFKREVIHKKMAYLNSLDIPVHYIDIIKPILPNIFVRVFNKIFKIPVKVKYPNRFDFLTDRNINKILISQGSSLDSIYIPDLQKFLLKTDIPFSILIQHNVEYGSINEEIRILANDVFNKAQKTLFVAERNLNVLKHQLASNISNAVFVQNPVNLISKETLPWPDEGITQFAVVARLEIDYKGQDLLLQAFSDLRWQKRTFQVNLFGEGPSKEYLEKLICYYNLKDKIFLRGHVGSIEKIWEENHILILPSHSEGTPMSLLEAMSCGRPAIVTDVGDNAKWIIDGVNGYVVPCSTAMSLNVVLEKAWSGKKEWERMGKLSRKEIEKRFVENPEKSVLEHVLN